MTVTDDGTFPGMALSPSELASWVRDETQCGMPVEYVQTVAHRLGLRRIETSSSLPHAGWLTVDDDEIVVRLRPGLSEWRRFTLAHEIGHYLLAVHQRLPLAAQCNDIRAEKYCNSFASHLLVDRKWLRELVTGRDLSLALVLLVAREASTTAATAMLALVDALAAEAQLVIWRQVRRTWEAQNHITTGKRHTVLLGPGGDKILDSAMETSVLRRRLPLVFSGQEYEMDVELLRIGQRVFAFHLASSMRLVRLVRQPA